MEQTAGFVIKRLMPHLGQSEAWWEKLLGVLAVGDRFIGVNRRHLRASDLGSALNCRMMGQTKTAIEVDTTLRRLVFKGTSATGESAAVFRGKTWGDVLNFMIENAPPYTEHCDRAATGEVSPGTLPHFIEVTMDVPLITLIWLGPDSRPGRADWYGPKGTYSHTTMIVRKTVVNGRIISVLGDILRAPAAILGVAEQEPESEAATPRGTGAAAKTRTIARARSRIPNNPILAAREREINLSHGGSGSANPGDTGQKNVRTSFLVSDSGDSL
jgi:hypothetical protein